MCIMSADPTRGLSSEEARRRLRTYGPNEVTPPRARPLRELLRVVSNPLVGILILASATSAALGGSADAVVILVIVALSLALQFVQTYRSQQAVDRLRGSVAPTARVFRDGRWTEIPRREVVPGDVIQLQAGDLVPADAELLESDHLYVEEAALTGEPLPVHKAAAPADPNEEPSLHSPRWVFLGTAVVGGRATALVRATGTRTVLGRLAGQLVTRPPETEFERGLREFAGLVSRTVVFLVLFVFLVRGLLHRELLDSFLFAVALAVGLTPELLPIVVTATLAQGAIRMARERVIVKRLEAIQNFGSIDILCTDKTGTLTQGEMSIELSVDPTGALSSHPLQLARMNATLATGTPNPFDRALLSSPSTEAELPQKLGEVPFDFERRRASVVVAGPRGPLLITKGAPESVLPLCTRYEAGTALRVLDADSREATTNVFRTFSARGYRVLAVAYREDATPTLSESDLVLAGYVVFSDPPHEDARSALEQLRADGIEVKVITGDHEAVAVEICRRVGLPVRGVLLGEQVDRLPDAALATLAEKVTVFARVSPIQKVRILVALKARGHVVGFLGDGVNDAPSLHAADVGISVANATEVARDAADIVLLERSLHVLHRGVLEGRRAFGNVVKYLLMATSSNFGNVLSMAVASAVLPFLPLLPTQVLLNNLLYDASQVAVPFDEVDPAFVRKPHRWRIGDIRTFMVLAGPLSSAFDFLTFLVLLRGFGADPVLFRSGWFVESLATRSSSSS